MHLLSGPPTNIASTQMKTHWLRRKAEREARGEGKGEPIGLRRMPKNDPEVEYGWRFACGDDLSNVRLPPNPKYDRDSVVSFLDEKFPALDRSFRKIACAMHYAVTKKPLRQRADRLSIVSPDFRCWAEQRESLAADYFAKRFRGGPSFEQWGAIVSGHHEVFQCKYGTSGQSFAMEMLFYGTLRVWVVSS